MTLDRVFVPAMPGSAIACENNGLTSEYGTLGCIVRDDPPFKGVYLLTSWHVIANTGGDPLATAVRQPGTNALPGEIIGVVSRWAMPVFTTTGFENLFDAAIAEVDPSSVTDETHLLGRAAGTNEIVADQTPVRMCGAKSEIRRGKVIDANFHCAFSYAVVKRRAGFQQQLLVVGDDNGPFSDGGDSGAGVVDDDNRLVGIILGKVDEGTVVCPIGPIFSALQVRLL